MKFYYLLIILFVLFYITFAEYITECQFINSILGQDKSYDCCSHTGITCSNEHITEMYFFFFYK